MIDFVLGAGLLAAIGITPTIVYTRLLRRSRREPTAAGAYSGAVVAILIGVTLALVLRNAMDLSVDVAPLVPIVAAAGLAGVYGELGHIRAAWAVLRDEEPEPV